MQVSSIFEISRRARRRALLCCATALLTCSAAAQNTPLISGAVGFFTEGNDGSKAYQPVIAPVLVAPLGKRLLVESRATVQETIAQSGNGYNTQFLASLQLLQLDYIANSRMTIVAGKFITPFGTFNERLSPIWISYLQDAPLIFGIGTRTSGFSDGGMVRGALFSTPRVQLNYNAYVSGSTQLHEFKSGRTAGGQAAIFLPRARLEIGASYQRFREGVHNNSYGVHVWWLPPNSAYQLRSEYAHGARSQGYWIESAYRLSRFGGPDSVLGRFQPVFRMQQSFRNLPNFPGQGDGLPGVDTKQIDFGFDYHLPREVRFNSGYSRVFATTDKNVWNINLTYRFLFPAWRGHK